MKILEVGACSILDHEFPKDIIWNKLYHRHQPEFFTECKQIDEFLLPLVNSDLDYQSIDTVIFSMGVRDTEYYLNSFVTIQDRHKMIDCLDRTMDWMDRLIRGNENPNRKFFLIGSSSVDLEYRQRPFYSTLKIAQSRFFKELAKNSTVGKFIEVRYNSVQSRMCNHGMKGTEAFNKFMEVLNMYYDTLVDKHVVINLY